jgi:dTDP-4-amino-4,6-dideoxygalactose transaminase
MVEAFERVLDHGQFILGPEVLTFEESLRERIGCHAVVGVASGTAALRLALRVRGVGAGDEVLAVSHSFFATSSAVVLEGATPVFVDVDEATMQVDVEDLARAATARTRAVIVVHLNGQPCEIERVREFCEQRQLALIEDSAQAIGVRSRSGRAVGNSGVGCFSLHPLKILSGVGDGGFLSVNNEDDAQRLRLLRNLGLAERGVCAEVAPNERLDALHAALLAVKLETLDQRIDCRRRNAQLYRDGLTAAVAAGDLRLPPSDEEGQFSTYTAFVVRHPKRDALVAKLHANGVDAKVHYPLATHQQPGFAMWRTRSLPVTERVVDQIISLPIHEGLGPDEIERCVDTVAAAQRTL